jgi:glutathione S-transferase
MSRSRPVLWHIPVSHYGEKARWALAHKRVEHERRAPPPGLHIPFAIALTPTLRPTFPVLQLEGKAIGDSTAIIAALERRFPEQPLYPVDAGERRRALALEEFFDEQLGPQIRLLAGHELTDAAEGPGMEQVAAAALPGPLRDFAPARRVRYKPPVPLPCVQYTCVDVTPMLVSDSGGVSTTSSKAAPDAGILG